MSDPALDSPAEERFQDEEASAAHNGLNGDAGSEDEDDVQTGRRKPTEAPVAEEEGEDDLFGDEDDAEQEEQPATRGLDDAELDSGDDEGRTDRVQQEEAEQYEERELLSMDLEMPRQAVPEPSDGEMYLMKVPDFMSIEPHAWQITTFQPPTTDHHSKRAPSSTFSAFDTATTTIRWRHSPNNPTELQSNARINRWSDGSLTLQLASDPNIQYEIDANSLAPPQRNPLKPTPTSINNVGSKGGREGTGAGEKYDPSKDAFTYLVTPVMEAEAVRVAHKITAGLSIKQVSDHDAALEQLQAALATAANATKVGGTTGTLEMVDIDPEQQRKEAEKAERDTARTRKRNENAQLREQQRNERASGRLSGRFGGGLNVGMLEDDEMDGGGGRGRSQAGRSRPKPRKRRNSEYSEDEDMGRRRFTREDSYDQEDDFLAPSDEEEEVIDDDDPDDGIVEEPRERTPKRDRPRPSMPAETSGLDDDEDAEGEPDDMPQARTKRRRIVDEDEDED